MFCFCPASTKLHSRWLHCHRTKGGGGALPMLNSTGMWRGYDPVLSHFTLKLPMQKASFTFILPTTCIPYFMAMTVHDNSSKYFCKAMPKTDLSIKSRPWQSIMCIYKQLQNKLQLRKYPKICFQYALQNFHFSLTMPMPYRVSVAQPTPTTFHRQCVHPSPGLSHSWVNQYILRIKFI